MVNCASVTIPDRTGSDDLLGQCADIRMKLAVRRNTDPTTTTLNWRSIMTLMKSILLGSAAGLVAVASAQAADLPTRKSAPAEYVKVCNVGGMAGFVLPGSDTCFKISGSVIAQASGGDLKR